MKKAVSGIVLMLLLTSMLSSAFTTQPVKAEWTGTVYIRADGSIYPPYAPISTVDNVTYILTGNITSNADGIVVERDNIIIDGAGYTLQGTEAYESKGINLSGRTNVTVQNTQIKNFDYGIKLSSSNYNIISGNNLTANNYSGIWLFSSSNNSISGNSIKNNEYGICLHICNNNHLSENIMDDNKYNLCVLHSSALSGYLNSIDASNLANGKPIFYLVNQTNLVINHATHPQVGYLGLVNCANITVEGLTIADNGQGILLAFTNTSRIMNNTLTNNGDGISMYSSSNNTVSGNIMTRNYDDGFVLGCSSNNTFYGNSITYNGGEGGNLWLSYGNIFDMNNIENNTYGFYLSRSSNNIISGNNLTANNYSGIHLYDSSGNSIFHNNFIDNTEQVYSSASTNVWDDGYPSGGNYWSDYNGTDLHWGTSQNKTGSDGIGDTPYIIDGQNRDNYPLMYPYGSPPPPYYNLTITTTSGGTTEPPPGTYSYTAGTTVNATAIPESGYSFDYWLLDSDVRTENPITITMDRNYTLTAYFVDDIPPELSEPSQYPPPEDVQPFQNVTVWVNVTDYGAGIKNVTLWYSLNNGTTWEQPINMTALPIPSDTTITYEATIPGYENSTWISYKIIAYDNAGNNATKDNNGYFYKYHVIPEFPTTIMLTLLMLTTLIATILLKKRRKTKPLTFLNFSVHPFSVIRLMLLAYSMNA